MSAREKLLNASLNLIREQGYTATTVDELCRAAGVTKGAFFHHFKSKEALAIAAADHWSEMTGGYFATAPYHQLDDPLDRVLGYVDFRREILQGELPEFTCLVGTMVQETYGSNPEIRDACARSILGHASVVEQDIELAMQLHGVDDDWTAASLALHMQAVIQGAFILAKATGDTQVAADSIGYLRRTIMCLFDHADSDEAKSKRLKKSPKR